MRPLLLLVAVIPIIVGTIAASCAAPDPHRRPANSRQLTPETPLSIEERVVQAELASHPRAEHKALDVLVGTWETRAVDVDPNGRELEPMTGHAAIAWIFNGRYLKWDETLDIGSSTHASTGFLGYDGLVLREYELLTIADLSTGMGVAYGKGEISGAGIRFTLDRVDPGSGESSRAESRLRAIDRDHVVLEVIGRDLMGNDNVLRRTYYHRAGAAK